VHFSLCLHVSVQCIPGISARLFYLRAQRARAVEGARDVIKQMATALNAAALSGSEGGAEAIRARALLSSVYADLTKELVYTHNLERGRGSKEGDAALGIAAAGAAGAAAGSPSEAKRSTFEQYAAAIAAKVNALPRVASFAGTTPKMLAAQALRQACRGRGAGVAARR
jgi:hypothetical protein